jgi:hypothetical protein
VGTNLWSKIVSRDVEKRGKAVLKGKIFIYVEPYFLIHVCLYRLICMYTFIENLVKSFLHFLQQQQGVNRNIQAQIRRGEDR